MNDFLDQISELCTGKNSPFFHILETGAFPKDWVDRYLSVLRENRMYWQNLDKWPKEVCHCFFRVGSHLDDSYLEWKRSSKAINIETEHAITKVKMFTEAFIAGGPHLKWELDDYS